MKTICEPRPKLDPKAEYPWNVQLWYSYDGGKTFSYSGQGRFFKDDDLALLDYIEDNRSPIRHFPIVTPELQHAFEQTAEDGYIPEICGDRGRACRQMSKTEGANKALCISCPLAKFCHAAEMMEYAKS